MSSFGILCGATECPHDCQYRRSSKELDQRFPGLLGWFHLLDSVNEFVSVLIGLDGFVKLREIKLSVSNFFLYRLLTSGTGLSLSDLLSLSP
jgi:hypothetical protein